MRQFDVWILKNMKQHIQNKTSIFVGDPPKVTPLLIIAWIMKMWVLNDLRSPVIWHCWYLTVAAIFRISTELQEMLKTRYPVTLTPWRWRRRCLMASVAIIIVQIYLGTLIQPPIHGREIHLCLPRWRDIWSLSRSGRSIKFLILSSLGVTNCSTSSSSFLVTPIPWVRQPSHLTNCVNCISSTTTKVDVTWTGLRLALCRLRMVHGVTPAGGFWCLQLRSLLLSVFFVSMKFSPLNLRISGFLRIIISKSTCRKEKLTNTEVNSQLHASQDLTYFVLGCKPFDLWMLPEAEQALCPLRALAAWIDASDLKDATGYIFRAPAAAGLAPPHGKTGHMVSEDSVPCHTVHWSAVLTTEIRGVHKAFSSQPHRH